MPFHWTDHVVGQPPGNPGHLPDDLFRRLDCCLPPGLVIGSHTSRCLAKAHPKTAPQQARFQPLWTAPWGCWILVDTAWQSPLTFHIGWWKLTSTLANAVQEPEHCTQIGWWKTRHSKRQLLECLCVCGIYEMYQSSHHPPWQRFSIALLLHKATMASCRYVTVVPMNAARLRGTWFSLFVWHRISRPRGFPHAEDPKKSKARPRLTMSNIVHW